MDNHSVPLDTIFHALADPTRRAVVQRLGAGETSVSELAKPFAMALPSFMKHISVLEQSKLIVSRKTGRVRICALDHQNMAIAERWFDQQRALWMSRYQKLDGLLKNLNGDDDAN